MGAENENLDVNPGSGIEEDSSTSSNQEADANANVSMLDFVKKAVDAKDATAEDEQQSETQSEESSTEESQETAETQEEKAEEGSDSKNELDQKEGEEKKSEDKTEESKDSEGPVPYERFSEVNEKYRKAEADLKEVEPLVKHHRDIVQYCTQHQISQKQFSEGLEVMALINSNPKEALTRLNKLVEDLQGFTGDRLPEDLQAKVDGGKIELADAREIAAARAQVRYGERSLAQHKAMQAQEQANRMQQQLLTAANAWVESKKADPDFKPKAKPDMPDGKWERVYDKFSAMLSQVDANGRPVNPVETPQQLTALMEKCYQAVQLGYGSANGKAATRKTLSHNGSSKGQQRTIESAKSMREAIEIAVGK